MSSQSALVKIGLLITCLLCVVCSIQQAIGISSGNSSHHCNSTKNGCISLDDVADKLNDLPPFFKIMFSIKYTGQHENSKLNANLDMSRNVIYE